MLNIKKAFDKKDIDLLDDALRNYLEGEKLGDAGAIAGYLSSTISKALEWEEKPEPVNLISLLRYRFKFSELKRGNSDAKYLRWHSQYIPNHGDDWHLELELGERNLHGGTKVQNVQFCWMNWDVGAGRRWRHIPNLEQVQTIDGLMELLKVLSAGKYKIEKRSDIEIQKSIEKHWEVFSVHGLLDGWTPNLLSSVK